MFLYYLHPNLNLKQYSPMSCTYLYDAAWIVLVKLDERPIHMYKCAEMHGQCRGAGLWNQDERDVHTRRVNISFMNVKTDASRV
jgi:hypothetical protein